MNQPFSFRAMQIIEDTLEAVQQADELGGLELEEYIRMMEYMANEMHTRKCCAIGNLLLKTSNKED